MGFYNGGTYRCQPGFDGSVALATTGDLLLSVASAPGAIKGAMSAISGIRRGLGTAKAGWQAVKCLISGSCFPAGTAIVTETGEKPIEQIQTGDLVLSADPISGEQSYQRVTQTFVRKAVGLVHINTRSGRSIESTLEHPLWVRGKGFVQAKCITRGDMLIDTQGQEIAVTSVALRSGKSSVYNFEVERTHTYYAAGYLVHNNCNEFTRLFQNGKGIYGVLEDGVVHFAVEAGAGSPVRGTELFGEMMAHFGQRARAVQGNWTYGDNLGKINELTAAGMPLAEAVNHTWTGTRAAKLGFSSSSVLEASGTAGNYSKVRALFSR